MNFKDPVFLVYLITFTDLFAIGLVYPLLNTHFQALGASHTFIGFMSSLYSALQVFSGPVIGSLTDIKGRLFILKCSIFMCGICYGLLGFNKYLGFIVVIRLVIGCVKHIQTICKAIITDIIPHDKQSEAYGKSTAVASFGFILGPFIGGHISALPNGFTYVCLFTMVLFFINIAFVKKLETSYKEIERNKKKNIIAKRPFFQQFKDEVRNSISDLKNVDWHKNWSTFTLRSLFGLSVSTFFFNQSLIQKEKYHLSQKHSGYITSYFNIVGTCSAFFLDYINRLIRIKDSCGRMSFFFSLLAVSVIAMYISSSLYTYLFVLIPFSLTCTALRILSMELILKNTDEFHRGSLSGVSNSLMSIARFVTPLVTGILGDKFGEESVILFAVIPALAGTLLSYYGGKKSVKLHES